MLNVVNQAATNALNVSFATLILDIEQVIISLYNF